LKNEYGLAPLRVRGLERVALHADLTILAGCLRRSPGRELFRSRRSVALHNLLESPVRGRSLLARLHNPHGWVCDCDPDCICKRTRLGRAFRWYIPRRFHPLPEST
jgi:hypothetical protein